METILKKLSVILTLLLLLQVTAPLLTEAETEVEKNQNEKLLQERESPLLKTNILSISEEKDSEGIVPFKEVSDEENKQEDSEGEHLKDENAENQINKQVNQDLFEEQSKANSTTLNKQKKKKQVSTKKVEPFEATETWGTAPYRIEGITAIIGGGTITNRMPEDIASTKIRIIEFTEKVELPEDSSSMFVKSYLNEIKGLENLDTSRVKNMSSMFAEPRFNPGKLSKLDLSSFDTRNVTDMSNMFNSSILNYIDVSGFDTRNVTNMSGMFGGTKVSTLNLSSFDTRNVTSMYGMFTKMSFIKELDLSNFNTSSLTDISFMFNYNDALKINLSSFDTRNISKRNDLFRGARRLEEIQLGEFFVFSIEGALPEISPTDKYNGKWTNGKVSFTAKDLANNYDGATMAGTWKRDDSGLRFKNVPDLLNFQTTALSGVKNHVVQREEAKWGFQIQDTRPTKEAWRLTAKQATPFTSKNGNVIRDALIFKKGNEEQVITDTNAVTIYEHDPSSTTIPVTYTIEWHENEGLLVKINPSQTLLGEYSSDIEWTLTDSPV